MAVNKVISSKAKTHSSMKACINYVLREDKTPDRLVAVTGPYDKEDINIQNVFDSFVEEKLNWNKDSGRMYMHSVLSFHKDEYITPEQALEIGIQLASEDPFYSKYQTLISVHQEKQHIHVHFVTNTVSYIDGIKEHHSANDVRELMERTNKMCLERGLTVTHKGQHFDGTTIQEPAIASFHNNEYRLNELKKESWKREILNTINEVLKTSSSKNEFIESMNNNGITVNWSDDRKHITFTDTYGHKVRASTLGKTFNVDYLKSKESLEARITNANVSVEKTTVRLPDISTSSVSQSVNSIKDIILNETRNAKEREQHSQRL